MYGRIRVGPKSGTTPCPLFGHEIEPRMWRRLPTFRPRNRAQKVAQAAHVSGTKSSPECGTGCPFFGHEIEPRMRRRFATFRARPRAQNSAQACHFSGTNPSPQKSVHVRIFSDMRSNPECGARARRFGHDIHASVCQGVASRSGLMRRVFGSPIALRSVPLVHSSACHAEGVPTSWSTCCVPLCVHLGMRCGRRAMVRRPPPPAPPSVWECAIAASVAVYR